MNSCSKLDGSLLGNNNNNNNPARLFWVMVCPPQRDSRYSGSELVVRNSHLAPFSVSEVHSNIIRLSPEHKTAFSQFTYQPTNWLTVYAAVDWFAIHIYSPLTQSMPIPPICQSLAPAATWSRHASPHTTPCCGSVVPTGA